MLTMKDQKLLIKIYEKEIEIKNETDRYLKDIGKSKKHVDSPIGLLPLPLQEIVESGVADKYRIGKSLANLKKHNLVIVFKSKKTEYLQRLLKKSKKKNGPHFNPIDSYRIKKIELTPEGRFVAEILIKADKR